MRIMVGVVGASDLGLALRVAAEVLADPLPAAREFGIYMVTSSIPLNFREKGRPKPWVTASRWGEPTPSPLFDRGELIRSISYVAEATGDGVTLEIGSGLVKAPYLQFGTAGLPGGVLRPVNAKFLALPVVRQGGLSKMQARTMRPRDYPGAFPLFHGGAPGYEGPGIYAKTTFSVPDPFAYARSRKGGGGKGSRAKGFRVPRAPKPKKGVVLLWRLVRQVRNPERPFVLFQPDDPQVFVLFLLREAFEAGPEARASMEGQLRGIFGRLSA